VKYRTTIVERFQYFKLETGCSIQNNNWR